MSWGKRAARAALPSDWPIPAFWLNSATVSWPSTSVTCDGEMGLLAPVETQELATSPIPFFWNEPRRPPRPPVPPTEPFFELRRLAAALMSWGFFNNASRFPMSYLLLKFRPLGASGGLGPSGTRYRHTAVRGDPFPGRRNSIPSSRFDSTAEPGTG